MQGYIDSHTHITNETLDIFEYLKDIEKAKEEGQEKSLLVYTEKEELKSYDLLKDDHYFDFAAGIFPTYADRYKEDDLKALEALLTKEGFVALGEIGLDYHWAKKIKDLQKELFIRQIELANKLDLPVIIHTREAMGDTYEILKAHEVKKKGVIHCFSGSKEMALELFKPHVIHGLVERDIVHNIKSAKKMIENQDERVWDVVEDVIKEHPVMLNRAPTLHRLGIQAFEPKLVSGKAIRLHPLVCAGFNADFDGDQMAVHVPLSEAAQAEARLLMLSSNNILDPKDGKPIVTPSQDMVLGNYYITTEKPGDKGEGRVFKNANEAIEAYERREDTLHARIALPAKSLKYNTFTDEQKEMYLVTTVGKLLFNEILPDGFQYINEPTKANYEGFTPMTHFLKRGSNIPEEIKKKEINKPFAKGDLKKIIAQVFKRYKTTETSIYLDKLKNLGFKYSTLSGISISIADVVKSEHKNEIIDKSQKVVDTINKQYRRGLITDRERYEKVCEVWNNTTSEVEKELKQKVQTLTDNPIMMMVNSGARGSIGQYNQMAGMRGLLAKPNGDAVEIPVTSSFVDGLSVSEYFISTHGTRKGNADTALKTADSGYLTRRLVDVVQDVIVREEDCGTIQGVVVKAFVDESDGTVIESLHERITGRYTNKKVVDPETKLLIID